MTRYTFLTLLSAAATLTLAGCAGYRLGPTEGRQAGARSIQVNPFANNTIEPRLTEPVTVSLRRKVQQDGTYQLDTRQEGDIVVTGTITKFNRVGVTFLQDDTRTARDYQIVIVARVKAVERATGRVLVDRPVVGRSTIRIGNDLDASQRQGVPLAAEDLARNITGLLVDGTW